MQGHGEAVPSHATLRKTYLPLEPENSEATGATQVASGTDRSWGLRSHCDFRTWQSTATEKHTDTLKASLQLNRLVSLEEMTEKNTTLEKQG